MKQRPFKSITFRMNGELPRIKQNFFKLYLLCLVRINALVFPQLAGYIVLFFSQLLLYL